MRGEAITLVGGPRDGQRMWWDGGEYIKFAYIEKLQPITYSSEDASGPVDIDYEVRFYRRSMVSRDKFVWQP